MDHRAMIRSDFMRLNVGRSKRRMESSGLIFLILMPRWKKFVSTVVAFVMSVATVPIGAQQTHPFAGITTIKIGVEPRMMAALEGKTEIQKRDETPESTLVIVMIGNQGYASYRDLGSTHTCFAWMRDEADATGSTVFGLGTSRHERQGIRLCSEFSLRWLSTDRVLLTLGGLARELPVVGHYPASDTDWHESAIKSFNLYGRGLGAVGAETRLSSGNGDSKVFGNIEFAEVPVDGSGAPGFRDFVRIQYDAAPAEPGGASYIFWASYDGRYTAPQLPTRSAFEKALFGKFGPPSIVSDEIRNVLYLWAHDVSGNLITDEEETRSLCLMGQHLTRRSALSKFRPGLGPSNCGVMMTVLAEFADGVNNVRETVAHTYRMELFHGRALALRRAASQMSVVQALRTEIEAKIDANEKMKLEF
jgi:hypothetical protein